MQLSFNSNNQISSSGYRYDAAGNLVMDAVNCYTYDAENRLSSVAPQTSPGSGVCGADTMSYLYDAEGRRVARLQNGAVVKQYYYDAAGHMITEANASGTTLRAEIYAGNRHLATWNGGATYFNHADWLGTERARTFGSGSQAGQICETITSLPFGDGQSIQAQNGGCGDPSPNHFTGLERDAESGLDHTLNRQYPSNIGRWLTPDPAGKKAVKLNDPQSWNVYAYVRNNPTTLTDPTGLIVWCSSSLNKKDAATCQSIIDTANQKDKNGNYVNPKLHEVYQRLNDDKRTFIISNAKLPGSEGAVFNVRQINTSRTDFASGTIQIDFAKIRNASATPASMVPGFTKYAGIAGDFSLKMAETFGHEGAHGVYALDNPLQAVAAQTLMNDSAQLLQMRAGSSNPDFLREQTAIGAFLNATETYAQQTEQIINQELNGGPNE
jgi:RHS repeat-associated protein